MLTNTVNLLYCLDYMRIFQAIQKAYHSEKLKCYQKLGKENLLLNNLKLLSQKILLLDQEQQKIMLMDESCPAEEKIMLIDRQI